MYLHQPTEQSAKDLKHQLCSRKPSSGVSGEDTVMTNSCDTTSSDSSEKNIESSQDKEDILSVLSR